MYAHRFLGTSHNISGHNLVFVTLPDQYDQSDRTWQRNLKALRCAYFNKFDVTSFMNEGCIFPD